MQFDLKWLAACAGVAGAEKLPPGQAASSSGWLSYAHGSERLLFAVNKLQDNTLHISFCSRQYITTMNGQFALVDHKAVLRGV